MGGRRRGTGLPGSDTSAHTVPCRAYHAAVDADFTTVGRLLLGGGALPDARPLARRQPHVRLGAGAAMRPHRQRRGGRPGGGQPVLRAGGGPVTSSLHRGPGPGPAFRPPRLRPRRRGTRRDDAGRHGGVALARGAERRLRGWVASRAGSARLAGDLHVVGTARRPAVGSCQVRTRRCPARTCEAGGAQLCRVHLPCGWIVRTEYRAGGAAW